MISSGWEKSNAPSRRSASYAARAAGKRRGSDLSSRFHRATRRAASLSFFSLALLLACSEGNGTPGAEKGGAGSLKVQVKALRGEVAAVEITLTPSRGDPLQPLLLQAPSGGGSWSETVQGIREGYYAVGARALDAADQQIFASLSTAALVLPDLETYLDLVFYERKESGSQQAPHFVSLSFSGQPSKDSNFRLNVTGGGGSGTLSLSGSGPGAFTAAGSDPRAGSYIDWAVPSQEGPTSITLRLEDSVGRSAQTVLDFEVVGLACDPGEQACNGVCVDIDDTLSDPLQCGPSCKNCGEGFCDQGICRPDPELANWKPAADVLDPNDFIYEGVSPGDVGAVDSVTGLMWERDYDTRGTSQSIGREYCDELTSGGYDDWRLPTRIELLSLVNGGTSGAPPNPPFAAVPVNHLAYWSSAPPDENLNGWVVLFSPLALRMGEMYPQSGGFTRCVRYGPDYPESDALPRYQLDLASDTFADRWTGLRWARNALADQTYAQALSQCEAQVYDGKPGRLPRKRELETVVDLRNDPPFVTHAVHETGARYWSAANLTRPGGVESGTCEGEGTYIVTDEGQTWIQCKTKLGVEVVESARCVWDEP